MRVPKYLNLVRDILTDDIKARKDDMYLWLKACERATGRPVSTFPLASIVVLCENGELPNIKTIERTRRKLQADYEELRATEDVELIRSQEEFAYREYFGGGN